MSIERGAIYFVNLNPVHGREQAGQRPVLVLSVNAINRLPLVVTVTSSMAWTPRHSRDSMGDNSTLWYLANAVN